MAVPLICPSLSLFISSLWLALAAAFQPPSRPSSSNALTTCARHIASRPPRLHAVKDSSGALDIDAETPRRVFLGGVGAAGIGVITLTAGGMGASAAAGEGEEGGEGSRLSEIASDIEYNEISSVRGLEIPLRKKSIPIEKFLGRRATLVVNIKLDDPESRQIGELKYLVDKYWKQGLTVMMFPTLQGWAEPDTDDTLRIRVYQTFGFGQYPQAVCFDKVDVIGPQAHPLYTYLGRQLRNPIAGKSWENISLNYEKFLLDGDGVPVRRYPRQWDPLEIEYDLRALLDGRQLGAPSKEFQLAWLKAERERKKDTYAYRENYNYFVDKAS